MVRALEKLFGSTPDLDIEEQRAIVVLKRPMSIDWKAVGERVKRANYTFGGAHLRARGRIVEEDSDVGTKTLILEFEGSGQRLKIKNPENARSLMGRTSEFALRVEDWNRDQARLVILNSL